MRTPLVLQFDDAECGAASLGIVLAHYGRWVPIEELREACRVSRDGSSALDVARAGARYGLKLRGRRLPVDGLRNLKLPAILFWRFNHFVVLEGFAPGSWYLNDPANGHRIVDEEEFEQSYSGIALAPEPGPDFRPGGARPSVLRRLGPWFRDVKAPLAFATACGLLLALPALALPFLLGVFVDYLLTGQEPSWAGPLTAAVAAAGMLQYLLTWMRHRCLRLLAARLAVEQADRLMRRLLRLPINYFAHRFAGDLTARVQLLDHVATVSTSQFVGVLIELVTSAAFLAVMFVYDPLLGAVVAALAVASGALLRLLSHQRVDENRSLRREQGKLQGIGMFGLRRIDTLQAVAAENDLYSRWSGYQARELLARQRFTELGYAIVSMPTLFLILGNAAVLGLGGWRVMSGEMSIGMMMAFYMIAANILQPVGRFVQFADIFQMLEAELQRLDDILNTPEDPSTGGGEKAREQPTALARRMRLNGQLDLRDVTFGFRPDKDPLIKDFNLSVKPGQRVAIVGPSGSGKSTLASLIAGLHQPWSGEILFDGHARGDIPRELLTESVSLVDQHIFLFGGTVRENLSLWDPEIPDEDVVAAGEDAAIHQTIIDRVGAYESPVEEGGRNFSGGQRQRLQIARGLVRDPSVLILDEATSALDAVREAQIDSALRRRGCTCIIIAHRLSTIRDSDLIIVLDEGREVQRGTHEALMAETDGIYRKLIRSDGTPTETTHG